MYAPPPPSPSEARFAASLGVSAADLPAVGEAFSEMMSRLGVDGKAIFQRLCDGQSLASALRTPPSAAPILYARAHSWFAIGRADRACSLFRALCALDGDVADHWVGYGICLKKLGRFEEAEKALAAGAALRPDWAIPHFHLAEAFIRTGDMARAQLSLADYDARTDEQTPDLVRAEAERYRIAIAIRTQASKPAERASNVPG